MAHKDVAAGQRSRRLPSSARDRSKLSKNLVRRGRSPLLPDNSVVGFGSVSWHSGADRDGPMKRLWLVLLICVLSFR